MWILLAALIGCAPAKDETGGCEAGAQRCSDDGAAIEECNNDAWATWQDCSGYCETNAGVPSCVDPAGDKDVG